jgi:hypothetical protein
MQYQPEKLLDLAHFLLPNDPTLVEEVNFCIKNPKEYLLTTMMMDSVPLSNLPWFALIHSLKQRNLIFTFDESLISAWFSTKHAKKSKRFAWVIRDGKWNESHFASSDPVSHPYVRFFFQLANHYLEPLQYVLCSLIPTLHPYTLTILPVQTAKHCQELAFESGYGTLWIEKDLPFQPEPHYGLLIPAFIHLLEKENPFWVS